MAAAAAAAVMMNVDDAVSAGQGGNGFPSEALMNDE